MKGELLRNIFLAGGSTMFTGMEARIAAEVKGGCSVGQAGDVQVRRKRDTCVALGVALVGHLCGCVTLI